jgi:DNA-binding response OmpR family regulator
MASRDTCQRVLIVEDDIDASDTLRDLLVLSGVPVVQAARSTADAERLLERGFRPSLVILDLRLDGESGESFARRLRSDPTHGGMRIIALSGDHVALGRVRGLVDRTFLKPASPVALMNALRELCGNG